MVSAAPARAPRVAFVVLAVRIGLILVWLLMMAEGATGARDATVADLERDLAAGRVTAIEVERADPDDSIQGRLGLRWDAGWRDSFVRYEYHGQQGVDEAAQLLDQAEAQGVPVQVVSLSEYPVHRSVTSDGWFASTFGPGVAVVAFLTFCASLMLLITSPPPWLATKWAWFWTTSAVPLLWLAYLALEPRPLRHSLQVARAHRVPAPLHLGPDRRLAGGWAFLLAGVLSGVLSAIGLAPLSGWG